jgi:hypothetical protein
MTSDKTFPVHGPGGRPSISTASPPFQKGQHRFSNGDEQTNLEQWLGIRDRGESELIDPVDKRVVLLDHIVGLVN